MRDHRAFRSEKFRGTNIALDCHMALGNLFKDVLGETARLVDDPDANELIVRRAEEAGHSLRRLVAALEHDLKSSVPDDFDPRQIRGRAYSCRTRFLPLPWKQLHKYQFDAFADWREVLYP